MKLRRIAGLLAAVLAALVLLPAGAGAEEAADLSAGLRFTAPKGSKKKTTHLNDGTYTEYWESKDMKEPYLILESETPIYGLYLCFQKMPESYVIQTGGEGHWTTAAEGDTRFYHVFYELDGARAVRILSTQEGKHSIGFNEVFAFGKGEIPDWVQRWEEPVEKADVLFLVAHPDDELLFMAGALPTYAVEMGRNVVIAYLSWSNTTRRSEALNGLWHMGIRNYPVFGGFRDAYSRDLSDAYDNVKKGRAGKEMVQGWVTELYRKYRPEVVVTQDLNGEYGHGQHKMVADAACKGYDLAADPEAFPETAQRYGTWQVKKLYVHLYGPEEDRTRFDWEVPLASMGGKTSLQLAAEAYTLHVTQKNASAKVKGVRFTFSVEDSCGGRYPNTSFGLFRSEVGPDETHTDFLEHVETAGE